MLTHTQVTSSVLSCQVEVPYHVRVLVPTYKETLDIVAKTVHAAYNAPLPVGCMRTIYVCDDGKDSSKRRWCVAPFSFIPFYSLKSLRDLAQAVYACDRLVECTFLCSFTGLGSGMGLTVNPKTSVPPNHMCLHQTEALESESGEPHESHPVWLLHMHLWLEGALLHNPNQ